VWRGDGKVYEGQGDPSLVEKLHSEDDGKVTGRKGVVSLALVASISCGLAGSFMVSPRL
jgi:hypothetical protein